MRSTAEDRRNADLIAKHLFASGRIFVSTADVIRVALRAAAERIAAGETLRAEH